jgi:hypothetical protein
MDERLSMKKTRCRLLVAGQKDNNRTPVIASEAKQSPD